MVRFLKIQSDLEKLYFVVLRSILCFFFPKIVVQNLKNLWSDGNPPLIIVETLAPFFQCHKNTLLKNEVSEVFEKEQPNVAVILCEQNLHVVKIKRSSFC